MAGPGETNSGTNGEISLEDDVFATLERVHTVLQGGHERFPATPSIEGRRLGEDLQDSMGRLSLEHMETLILGLELPKADEQPDQAEALEGLNQAWQAYFEELDGRRGADLVKPLYVAMQNERLARRLEGARIFAVLHSYAPSSSITALSRKGKEIDFPGMAEGTFDAIKVGSANGSVHTGSLSVVPPEGASEKIDRLRIRPLGPDYSKNIGLHIEIPGEGDEEQVEPPTGEFRLPVSA